VTKPKGRKLTTGRYSTVDELYQNVSFYYYETKQNITQVARTTGVSTATVQKILRSKLK